MIKTLDALDFNNNQVINQHIGAMFADGLASVHYRHFELTQDMKSIQ